MQYQLVGVAFEEGQYAYVSSIAILLISVPFEHSVRAVNYSVVVLRSQARSRTDWHLTLPHTDQ